MTQKFETFNDTIARLYPENSSVDSVKNITFCVTNACQLRCTYCYERHKGNQSMKLETAKKFIDLLLTGEKNMDQYVTTEKSIGCILEFIGGEPMLEVELIDDIINYFLDRVTELNHPWAECFMISICSNGINYFEPKVQRFLDKWEKNLSFSITLDGNKELHDACRHYAGTIKGCYDEVHAACENVMSTRKYHLGSKMTYAPENLSYMYDAMVAMLDDGYSEISSNCAYEPEYTIDDAKLFYVQGKKIADELLRRNLDLTRDYRISIFDENYFHPKKVGDDQNWCGGTGLMISCDWDGKIYPCIRYMEMSIGDDQEPYIIGDVDNGILSTDEYKKRYENLLKIDRRTQSTDECYYCPIAEGCSWCSAWNYQLYGTADKRCTNICIMHKARALFNYYYWNKFYRLKNLDKRMEIHIPKEWALEIINEDEWNMLLQLSEV